ncbi:MAG TPA: hypothetical protein VGX94_10970 [Terriglobia bacterium]|nr:hypothetical protein [Terriglobia bacterium]
MKAIFPPPTPSNAGVIGGVLDRLTGVRNVKAVDAGRFGNSGWNYLEGLPAPPNRGGDFYVENQ